MSILRCHNLRKSFGGVVALDDVSLQFEAPGIVGIIGPNGAGKTTLFNVLTGSLRADSGHSFVGQVETSELPPYRIARLGVARSFQELRLIREISVLDNVLLSFQQSRGERLRQAIMRFSFASSEANEKEKAIAILKWSGLASMANIAAGQLSYGQQKLLVLACCLGMQSSILLLDEPISGVDPEMADEILARLMQLRDEGKLVVFIEHDLVAVGKVADWVVLMGFGKVIANVPPAELLNKPQIMEVYFG